MTTDNELYKVKEFILDALQKSPYWKEFFSAYNAFPEIVWMNTRSRRVAGTANRGTKKISINPHYYRTYGFEGMKETMIHELCHVIQFVLYPKAKQAHGPEWKRIMMNFGYAPDTCHTMALPKIERSPKYVPQKKNKKTRYVYTDQTGKIYHFTKKSHERIQYQGFAHVKGSNRPIHSSEFIKTITVY